MKTTDRKASPSKDLTPVAGERQRIFASAAAAPESQEVRRSSKIPRSPDSRFAASLPGLEKRKRPAARAEKQRGAGKETAQGQESMPNENLQRRVTRSESRRKNTGQGTRNRAHPAFPPRAKATGLKTSTPQSLSTRTTMVNTTAKSESAPAACNASQFPQPPQRDAPSTTKWYDKSIANRPSSPPPQNRPPSR